MKNLIMIAALMSSVRSLAAPETLTFKSNELCANGLTITFTMDREGETLIHDDSDKIYGKCLKPHQPTGPGDTDCAEAEVLGFIDRYQVQIGTITYSDNRGKFYTGPIAIWVFDEFLWDRDLWHEDELQYKIGYSPHSPSPVMTAAAKNIWVNDRSFDPLPRSNEKKIFKKAVGWGIKFPGVANYFDLKDILQNRTELKARVRSCESENDHSDRIVTLEN